MGSSPLEILISLLARLPGLGPRSARRAALHIATHKHDLLTPLHETLGEVADKIIFCEICFMLSTQSPCEICTDPRRATASLCVVENTNDVWALERALAHRGRYHVLGGALNALDGIGPEDLHTESLLARVKPPITEIIFATSATIDGQTTAHYLAELLAHYDVSLSRLARGVPMGGELDYLDDGTLADAMRQRRPFS